MTSDHYKTLLIEKSADTKAIKTAFRFLAKRFHPDRNPSDPTAPARFREIVEAYDVLRNDAKRAAYDLGARRASSEPSPSQPRTHPRYEHTASATRIERAIEVLGRFHKLGGHETWRTEVQAWAFLRAKDEVYELQATLRGQFGNSVPTQTERDRMAARLERFHSAMASWKSHQVFSTIDGVDQPGDYEDRSRVTFITNPDVAAVKAKNESDCRVWVTAYPGERMNDPECWRRSSFTLGARTHVGLAPALIRITDLQTNLDVLLICADYAKKRWMGRWTLDSTDDAEFLFRAAVAAEIVGVKTLGYEIPADRRAEADWVKLKADRRMVYKGQENPAARLASGRRSSLEHGNYVRFDQADKRPIPLHWRLTIDSQRDLAGPIDRLRRVFSNQPRRYMHSTFYHDMDL